MISKTTLLKPLILTLFFCLTFSFSDAQVLVAHYNFDNSLADETGEWGLSVGTDFTPTFETGFDGTPNGAVSGFSETDFLRTEDVFPISGNESRTMTVWVRLDGDAFNAILGLGTNVQDPPLRRWTFAVNPNGVNRIEVQGGGFINEDAGEISIGVWTHLAVTYNADTGLTQLYQNGEPGSSGTFSGPLDTAPSVLRVGNDHQLISPDRGFQGALDDMRIFAGALSDQDVKDIYDNSLLSVNDVSAVESFTAYPNPVENRLYFSSNEVSNVEVYNLLGAKVLTQKVNNGVDTSSLDKGVYLVNCFNAQGIKMKTVKILK